MQVKKEIPLVADLDEKKEKIKFALKITESIKKKLHQRPKQHFKMIVNHPISGWFFYGLIFYLQIAYR
jgi:hypothetical protein